ncbi:hypothetical protein [Comamonas serinivorans]|nr:hypothetical protein [Comamonas serinivorans]
MSTETKRFAYAVVGLRPSERQEIERLLTAASEHTAELLPAAAGEHADFWVVNGDDPGSVQRLQTEGIAHVLAVGGEQDQFLRVMRPFDVSQTHQVLTKLIRQLPDRPRREAPVSRLESYAETDPWADRDSSQFSEFSSSLELTPSELAMTDDEPSDLRLARRAEHERRMSSSHTLGPTDILDFASQEWLDVWPAQVLVVADAEHRTRTLPKGLRKMGFGVDVMENVAAALKAVARSEYRMVFLDQGALGAGLVRWCKAFLQTANAQGMLPGVVVVARRKAPVSRWRAKRAGCTAWMEVPLDRQQLLSFLLHRGVERSQPRDAQSE